MTASFDTAPATSYATDVAAWKGGYVAIGNAWESEFHVSEEMPAIWSSVDGESWVEQPIVLGVNNVSLIGVAPRADGRLLLMGNIPGTGALAWASDDASTWQAVDLPFAADAVIDSFDHGPRGYVLAADRDVWYSADGTDWTITYEGASGVVAGDEGFVAISSAPGDRGVVASGDGDSWHPSSSIAGAVTDVAALGGDWVATAGTSEPITSTVWRSANGLDWSPGIDVNSLTGPGGPKTGGGLNDPTIGRVQLAGGAGNVFVMLTNNHCCAQMEWSYGVWGTADGLTWASAVVGDSFVSSVASNGETTVLVGHLGRGDDAAFWIGDP